MSLLAYVRTSRDLRSLCYQYGALAVALEAAHLWGGWLYDECPIAIIELQDGIFVFELDAAGIVVSLCNLDALRIRYPNAFCDVSVRHAIRDHDDINSLARSLELTAENLGHDRVAKALERVTRQSLKSGDIVYDGKNGRIRSCLTNTGRLKFSCEMW